MAYDVTVITTNGASLLASATAANKLILAGCDATTEVLTEAQALAVSSRPVSPLSNTTKVYLEGSYEEHVYCRIMFVAGESTGGDANTLYLYGHSESDPSNDIVLAVMSSSTAFHLPLVGEVSNTYGTLLDIVYSAETGAIETINTSVFTTLAEFLRLRNRTVTTYKDGDPTSGDDQTILGTKTFSDWTNLHKTQLCDVRYDTQIAGYGWVPGAGEASHYRLGLLNSTALNPNVESAWYNAIELYGYSPEDDMANNDIYIKSMNAMGNRGAYAYVGHGDDEPGVALDTKYIENTYNFEQQIRLNPTSIWISVKNTEFSNQDAMLSIDYNSSTHNLPVLRPMVDDTWSLGDDSYRFARAYVDAIYGNDIYAINAVKPGGTTLKLDASNSLQNATLTAEYNKNYNNGVSYELELTQTHNLNIDCSVSDTMYVDYSSASTGDSTTVRVVQCELNTGKIIQKADTTSCKTTLTCSSTNDNYNRGYLQVANNGVTLAVNGATSDVLSRIGMTTSTLIFELQDTTYGINDVKFQYIEDQSSTHVYSFVPDPATGSRIDIGTSTAPFGKVYADDFIGSLNGYSNFVVSISAGTATPTITFTTSGSAVGTDVDLGVPISKGLIGSGLNSYGSLRLCFFKLSVTTGESGQTYPAGTVYNSEDTSSGLSSLGELIPLAMNGTGLHSPSASNFTFPLTGKWMTLNDIHFDANTESGTWAIVLAVKTT